MPILGTDLLEFHSGAGSNSNIANDLGGAISSAQITDNTANNAFRDITGDEASTGITLYRAHYLKNNHGSLTLQSSKFWIASQAATGTTIALALAAEGLNTAIATTLANETTAPPTVTFSSPANKGAGLSVGNVPNGQFYGFWLRNTIGASTAAATNTAYTLTWEGDTAA